MLIDGNTLSKGTEIGASVCIVGSGPAGLTLATELLEAGVTAVVLESGSTAIEAWAQALNDGPVVGDPYAGLRNTRQRQLGGTIQAWNTPVGDDIGAKYAPLDRHDLRTSQVTGEPTGWPIDYDELATFYPRAQRVCGLGQFDYSSGPMLEAGRRPFDLDVGNLVSKVYQFGRSAQFLDTHVRALQDGVGVDVYTNLTVSAIDVGTRREVGALQATTRAGAAVRVRARDFVLAGGAVENARLLLLFQAAVPHLIEDPRGWLGRCFMEHPRDNALVLLAKRAEVFDQARFYDVCERTDGATICGRLAFADGPPPGSALPNMSVTLLPRARVAKSWLERMRLRRPSIGGYNWSSIRDPERRFDGFRLLINMEQRPRRENRIVLCAERDALGQPRAELHWRFSPDERASLRKLRALIARELESCGMGHVEIDDVRPPDPNAHHHAGTTRMAASPRDGVVDRNCRVFGTDNLYCAGASVFPTAGFANPTLTVVAMACRLAANLRGSRETLDSPK